MFIWYDLFFLVKLNSFSRTEFVDGFICLESFIPNESPRGLNMYLNINNNYFPLFYSKLTFFCNSIFKTANDCLCLGCIRK